MGHSAPNIIADREFLVSDASSADAAAGVPSRNSDRFAVSLEVGTGTVFRVKSKMNLCELFIKLTTLNARSTHLALRYTNASVLSTTENWNGYTADFT